MSIALHCQVAAQAFFSLPPPPKEKLTASTLVICLSFCFWVFSEGFWFVVFLFVWFRVGFLQINRELVLGVKYIYIYIEGSVAAAARPQLSTLGV